MRGVPISEEVKEEVLKLYAAGKSYAKIEQMTGVSRASTSAIVSERSRRDPDFQLVQQVARICREKNAAPESFLRGAAVDERIEAASSSLDEVERVVIPFLKEAGPEAAEYCKSGKEYKKVVEETGYTHTQLLAEHRKRKSEVDEMTKRIDASQAQEATLSESVQSLASRLGHLDELEAIDTSLKKIHKGPRDAAKILSKNEWFWKMGLSESVMNALVAELSKIGFKDKDGATKIADLVKKYGTLEEAVAQEARVLDKLKVETAKMISDRALLGEKVEALRKRCHELELRAERLSNESASMETSFKERRKELDQKSTAVEEEIKALTTRLSELQSQILALENQIMEKEAKLRGLASQKVSEQKALSDLEAKKRDASVDYQTVIRALGGLRSELAELKRTYNELEAEYNRKAGVYQNEISRLKGQVLTLQNEESELSKAIAESKEALDRIGDTIEKNAYLFVLVSVVGGKELSLKPAEALEPAHVMLEAYRGYIEKHQREIPGSAEMIAALTRLTTLLVEVIRFGNR